MSKKYTIKKNVFRYFLIVPTLVIIFSIICTSCGRLKNVNDDFSAEVPAGNNSPTCVPIANNVPPGNNQGNNYLGGSSQQSSESKSDKDKGKKEPNPEPDKSEDKEPRDEGKKEPKDKVPGDGDKKEPKDKKDLEDKKQKEQQEGKIEKLKEGINQACNSKQFDKFIELSVKLLVIEKGEGNINNKDLADFLEEQARQYKLCDSANSNWVYAPVKKLVCEIAKALLQMHISDESLHSLTDVNSVSYNEIARLMCENKKNLDTPGGGMASFGSSCYLNAALQVFLRCGFFEESDSELEQEIARLGSCCEKELLEGLKSIHNCIKESRSIKFYDLHKIRYAVSMLNGDLNAEEDKYGDVLSVYMCAMNANSKLRKKHNLAFDLLSKGNATSSATSIQRWKNEIFINFLDYRAEFNQSTSLSMADFFRLKIQNLRSAQNSALFPSIIYVRNESVTFDKTKKDCIQWLQKRDGGSDINAPGDDVYVYKFSDQGKVNEFEIEGKKYQLSGAITQEKGHITCCIKDNNAWIEYDDQNCKRLEEFPGKILYAVAFIYKKVAD